MKNTEVIWIERDDDCPYFYVKDELADAAPPLTAYVRADIVTDFFSWANKTWPYPGDATNHPWNRLGQVINDIDA